MGARVVLVIGSGLRPGVAEEYGLRPLGEARVVVLDLDARPVGGKLHLQVAACLRVQSARRGGSRRNSSLTERDGNAPVPVPLRHQPLLQVVHVVPVLPALTCSLSSSGTGSV